MSKFDWGYKEAQKIMGKASGGPVQVKGYMRGGPVKKSDAAQDKALMARHNRLMHPGQASKLAKGGTAKKRGC